MLPQHFQLLPLVWPHSCAPCPEAATVLARKCSVGEFQFFVQLNRSGRQVGIHDIYRLRGFFLRRLRLSPAATFAEHYRTLRTMQTVLQV